MAADTLTYTIKTINGNPYVTPGAVSLGRVFRRAGKKTSPIPIKGEINGSGFRQSLVRYSGEWRLYVNGDMAKSAGIKYKGSITAIVGRKIKIEFDFDDKPTLYPIPRELKDALSKDNKARAEYEKLTPGRKKEIHRYLGFLKSKVSVDRNVKRILRHLRGEKTDALHPLMHTKK